MTGAFAGALAYQGKELACGGRLTILRWRLDAERVELGALAAELGRAYVSDQQVWQHPGASVRPRLPDDDHPTVRMGDLGELLGVALYRVRLGSEVPFLKIQSKPVGNATEQGPDVLAVSLASIDEARPVTVEVKARAGRGPGEILTSIANNLATIDESYLQSAWAAGVQLMGTHPDHRRAFALTAAQHLARLIDPERTHPPHEAHAVAVVDKDNLTAAKAKQYWKSVPPVSELHVIEVPDLVDLRDRLFEAAGRLSYGQLAALAPTLLGAGSYTPGFTAPVSSGDPGRQSPPVPPGPYALIVESALWYLADWDGLGLARARAAREDSEARLVVGLAEILSGAVGTAISTLRDTTLEDYAKTASQVLRLQQKAGALTIAMTELVGALGDEQLCQALRHTTAALIYRLERHPELLAAEQGATGEVITHVVKRLQRIGRYALWPSQAQAVRGGLLDPGLPSLAIRMPTSAGKTTLIELLVAQTLDSADQPVIAVLAPTKALVSQLTSDLREALPKSVEVRSSHGGLDFDTDSPAAVGLVSGGGVAVLTPERFDLEWRRAATGDETALADLELLVVDEAHLINDTTRGVSLELSIARALRRGVRVAILSSQFTKMDQLAVWLGGQAVESDWTPAWLDRLVYFRVKNDDEEFGVLANEAGGKKRAFDLKPSIRSSGDAVPRVRREETAELVYRFSPGGLVVAFSDKKSYILELVEAIGRRLGSLDEPDDGLNDLAQGIEASEPWLANMLRRGIGVHHADIARSARRAVETAARQRKLRCVVCTSTLLEGVDFPTRTVVAAYPPHPHHGPQVARLRNLAGRAGRGGQFTDGRLVVMTNDKPGARKWLRLMRASLPATNSALTQALKLLQATAETRLADLKSAPETVDTLILAAFAEGSVADGELRRHLEESLGRTLWFPTTQPNQQERLMSKAVTRAAFVRQSAGSAEISTAFYRSGLPFQTCLTLKGLLQQHGGDLAGKIKDDSADHDELLLVLATEYAAIAGAPLDHWNGVDQISLKKALRLWLRGHPNDQIVKAHPEAWNSVESQDLETRLPWVVTGVIEIIAALHGSQDLRETAHRRLGLSRLRYGVPHQDLCELAREHDRVLLTQLAQEFEDASSWPQLAPPLRDFVERRLVELSQEDEDTTEERTTQGPTSREPRVSTGSRDQEGIST